MASSQCEKKAEVAVQFSAKEKAIFDELIKQAQHSCGQARAIVAQKEGKNEAGAARFILTVVAGVLTNWTNEALPIKDRHIWMGSVVVDYSDPLNSTGAFTLTSGFFQNGVEAAVVYKGKNSKGVNCAWLIAYADTNTGTKIYAECGREEKFDNINWTEVKTHLDRAGAVVWVSDSETGTSVKGTLVGSSGASALAAAFDD